MPAAIQKGMDSEWMEIRAGGVWIAVLETLIPSVVDTAPSFTDPGRRVCRQVHSRVPDTRWPIRERTHTRARALKHAELLTDHESPSISYLCTNNDHH